MNSSSGEKAAAASAEFVDKSIDRSSVEERTVADSETCTVGSNGRPEVPSPKSAVFPDSLVPSRFDLENLDPNDFDHEFDDDFEAEIPGEYELDDDEYAKALLDIVDFEIEGLERYRDDE